MSIDVKHEKLIPLSQVPKLPFVPKRRNGKRLHVSTVFRWAQRGLKGIQLEWVQFGGTKCTSVAAIQRFLDALSEREGSPRPPNWMSPATRRRHEAAVRRLDKIFGPRSRDTNRPTPRSKSS